MAGFSPGAAAAVGVPGPAGANVVAARLGAAGRGGVELKGSAWAAVTKSAVINKESMVALLWMREGLQAFDG